MKKKAWIIILIALALALAACGEKATEAPVEQPQPEQQQQQPAAAPTSSQSNTGSPASDETSATFHAAMEGVETTVERFFDGIPVPDDASIQTRRDEKVELITTMTVAEATQWYRDTFTSLGLIEVEELTKESEFSTTTYWGGYPNGQAIIVKVSKLSPSSSKVTVYFKDL